jgi:hypothetical protein
MSNKAVILCFYILLAITIAFPCTARSQEFSIPLDRRAQQLFEQLQDIDLLQRNIAQMYQAENKTILNASLALRSAGEPMELDRTLVDRVFNRLCDTPEYRSFMKAYQAVIQRPDYSRLYVTEMYGEYMRLLDSARARLRTELKEKAAAF